MKIAPTTAATHARLAHSHANGRDQRARWPRTIGAVPTLPRSSSERSYGRLCAALERYVQNNARLNSATRETGLVGRLAELDRNVRVAVGSDRPGRRDVAI